MLIGIVKKNAIMMIDFAIEAQRSGKSAAEAIHEGCLLRFRPIMMTTMAALMATLPIALGFGAGGAARRSLGLAVVGGLVVSQCLTLYITPVVYLYLEASHQWYLRKQRIADPAIHTWNQADGCVMPALNQPAGCRFPKPQKRCSPRRAAGVSLRQVRHAPP